LITSASNSYTLVCEELEILSDDLELGT
jgi:hypothetical protein